MSTYFSLTVPESKEHLNQNVRRFVIQQGKSHEITETKDGTIYQLEFNSELQKKSFEIELGERFPFLFN